VVGALLGGVLADWLGLRPTYFLSIPLAICSIGALVAFREPMLHKKSMGVSLKAQVAETLRAVSSAGLRYTLVALIGISLISEIIFEFNQLWLIALSAPLIWYGPANALLYSAQGFGGLLAPRLRLNRRIVQFSLIGLLLVAALGLVIFREVTAVVAAQLVVATLLISMDVIFKGYMHDALPSEVRAGSASAVSTLVLFFFMPFSLLFGAVSARFDIFAAAWIIVGLLVLLCPIMIRVASKKSGGVV
jgi:hypothetical protein